MSRTPSGSEWLSVAQAKLLEADMVFKMRLTQSMILPLLGQRFRRMGDPEEERKGLVGLGKVPDEIKREILSRDGVKGYPRISVRSSSNRTRSRPGCIRT